jgi:hypothetical protein
MEFLFLVSKIWYDYMRLYKKAMLILCHKEWNLYFTSKTILEQYKQALLYSYYTLLYNAH